MAAVWLGRFSRWLEALVNAKGGPVVVDIDPSMRMVAVLQEGNEDRYLQGWNRFGVSLAIPALAANAGVVRLRNPAGSNVVAVIESVIFFNQTAVTDNPFATWGATVTDFATLASLTFTRIDPRGNPQPTCIVSGVATAAGASFMQISIPAATSAQFVPNQNTEWTVLPGQIWQVQSAIVNSGITVSYIWRERALQQSELT